jgi:uncharacterized membrane protein YbhN (UPF0104 family)
MQHRLIAAARKLNTSDNWNRLAIVLSVLVIAFAVATLVHVLRGVDPGRVYTAIKAVPAHNIVGAGLLVALAYVTLTFYDLFALRTIGRADVPYRMAAFAAFSSYSIGHNIGATVFTGNAIRFRLYSAYDLTIVDIAKLAFITGLTFWLGNAVVLGLGVCYEPEAASAINHLPGWLNRALAIFVLVVVAAYLSWVGRQQRVFGRDNWQITLPGARLTLVQIGIGILDLGLSSLAMYTLLPAGPGGNFVAILVTFIFATLLGFASHAPGGLGVFDAAMLIALPQFEKETLLASLLLFRLIYYVAPFTLALALVGGREFGASLAARADPDPTKRAPGARAALKAKAGKALPR